MSICYNRRPRFQQGRQLERVGRPRHPCEHRQGASPPVRAAKKTARTRKPQTKCGSCGFRRRMSFGLPNPASILRGKGTVRGLWRERQAAMRLDSRRHPNAAMQRLLSIGHSCCTLAFGQERPLAVMSNRGPECLLRTAPSPIEIFKTRSGHMQSSTRSSDSQPRSFFPRTEPVTLVLLPGLDGTGILFAPFVEALGTGRPAIVVTYPPSGEPQTYANLHDFAEAALPPNGPLVLLGESFSGPIAISLAAANPKRVLGVVLCCTFVRNPRPSLRWLRGLASVPAPLPPSPILSAMLFGRFATPGLQLMLRDALAAVQPAVLRARIRAVFSVDVRAQARTLTVPILYLKANSDRLVPSTAAIEAKQSCRDMTIQSFDAPHCLLQVVPEEAADIVADFLETVTTS